MFLIPYQEIEFMIIILIVAKILFKISTTEDKIKEISKELNNEIIIKNYLKEIKTNYRIIILLLIILFFIAKK